MKRYEVKITSMEGDQEIGVEADTAEGAMRGAIRFFEDWLLGMLLTEFDIEASCGDEHEKRSVKVQYSFLPFTPETV